MLSWDKQLEAISWKCDELDTSYGKLVNKSSPEEIQQFYREYEKHMAAKKNVQSVRENARSHSASQDKKSFVEKRYPH